MTNVLGSRGIRRFGVLVAAVASIMVVLASNAERAEATSKWNSCASGVPSTLLGREGSSCYVSMNCF